MSRVFEALQQLNIEAGLADVDPDALLISLPVVAGPDPELAALRRVPQFSLRFRPESRLVALSEPNSLAAEKLRGLATRLRQAQTRRPMKKLLVTSAMGGDGKSVISANLAITLASRGQKTLLIDGDLHKPTLHKLLEIEGAEGFAQWAELNAPIADYLHREERMPLWFLPAGICTEQPLSRIESEGTDGLLKQLSDWFDWIVIDSPPLVPLTDSSVWAAMCDSVLLLVREGVTAKRTFMKAFESIDKSKLFGILLNDAGSSDTKYYAQYYSDAGHTKSTR